MKIEVEPSFRVGPHGVNAYLLGEFIAAWDTVSGIVMRRSDVSNVRELSQECAKRWARAQEEQSE